MELERLLSRKEAAPWLGLKVSALEAMATRGGGPRFVKTGRLVRYRLSDLQAWLEARTFQRTGVPALAGEEGAGK